MSLGINNSAFSRSASRTTNKKRPWNAEEKQVQEKESIPSDYVIKESPYEITQELLSSVLDGIEIIAKPEETKEVCLIKGSPYGISQEVLPSKRSEQNNESISVSRVITHEALLERWRKIPSRFEFQEREAFQLLLSRYPDDVDALYKELVRLEAIDIETYPLKLLVNSWPKVRISLST